MGLGLSSTITEIRNPLYELKSTAFVPITCNMTVSEEELNIVSNVVTRCLSTYETTDSRNNTFLSGSVEYRDVNSQCKPSLFKITASFKNQTMTLPTNHHYHNIAIGDGIASCQFASKYNEYANKFASCIVQLMNEQGSSQSSLPSSQDSVTSCSGRQAAKNRERELDHVGRANELQLVKRLKTLTQTKPIPLGNWVINEIFLKKGYEITDFDFIELKHTGLLPEDKPDLNNYKLIAITNCNSQGEFKVDFIVNLSRSKVPPGHRLFTVSGGSYRDNVPGTQLVTTKKQGFKYFHDCDPNRVTRTYRSDDPYILLLVYDDDQQVRVTKECLKNSLTHHELKQLKEQIVDVVVYHHDGHNAVINRYGHIDLDKDLIPLSLPYVLKDYQIQSSIGRCNLLNVAPRQPSIFKFMPPTYTLDPNICTEETYLLDCCLSRQPSYMPPPNLDARSNSTIAAVQELENVLRNLEQRVTPRSSIPERTWESVAYFNNDMLNLISPDFVSIAVARENSNWLLVDRTDRDIRLKCRLCGGHPLTATGRESNFAGDGQELSQVTRYRGNNDQAIRRHRESVQHGIVEADFIQRNINEIKASLGITPPTTDEDRIYRVTANVFRTVYGAVIGNIPLVGVPRMFDIININQNDSYAMGYHHNDRRTHVRMLSLVSDSLNRLQFNNLMDIPWTVSLDGVTDRSNRYFMVILISYVDIQTRSLVVRFFDLVHITGPTNAEAQALAVIEQFNERGLRTALTQQLASMNSDSANVMRGVRNSVLTRLQALRGRHVMNFGCANHNLHLALSDSLKSEDETQWLEGILDDVRQFLNTGYKRHNVYTQISEALGEAALLIMKLSPVKWITSQYDIMRRFLSSYLKLAMTLEAISYDNNFDRNTRASAQRLLARMLQRDNLIWTAAIVDLLRPVSRMNQQLQASELSIVDASTIIEECLGELQRIMDGGGPSDFTPMINLIRISVVHEEPYSLPVVPNDLNELLNHNTLRLYAIDVNRPIPPVSLIHHTHDGPSIVLTHDSNSPSPFSFQRFTEIGRAVIEAIEQRMINGQNIRHLQLFRNEIIPSDRGQRNIFVDRIINNQLPLFAYEYNELSEFLSEYHAMLDSVLQHPAFILKRAAKSILFWTFFLEQRSDAFPPRLRRIILSILSIPVSNAVTERSLSIMSNAQRRGRNTKPQTLSRMMNLKINGPGLSDFDAVGYAKEWKRGGHWLSDCKYRAEGDPKKKKDDTCRPETDSTAPQGADLGPGLGYCEGAVGGCPPGEEVDDEDDGWDEFDDE